MTEQADAGPRPRRSIKSILARLARSRCLLDC
jgi:hypothetical protein